MSERENKTGHTGNRVSPRQDRKGTHGITRNGIRKGNGDQDSQYNQKAKETYMTPEGTSGPRMKKGTLMSNSNGIDFPLTKPN